MLITVHSTLKEAKPRRALLMAIGLLVVTTGLAYRLTEERRKNPLGAAVSLHPLPIEFNPPKGFNRIGVDLERRRATLVGYANQGDYAAITVWYLPSVEPAELHELARDAILGLPEELGGGTRDIAITDRKGEIGKDTGVELAGLADGVVARIAAINSRATCIVCMSVKNGAIDQALYEVFDLSCRSVRLNTSGKR